MQTQHSDDTKLLMMTGWVVGIIAVAVVAGWYFGLI